MNIGLIIHTLVQNSQGQILVLHRQPDDIDLPHVWDIPGGTLEVGEDPTEGAIRETREETGLDIHKPRLFFYTSNIDQEKNKQFIRLIFHAKITSGNIRLRPEEHSDYRWIDPANPPNLPYVDYLPDCFKWLKK